MAVILKLWCVSNYLKIFSKIYPRCGKQIFTSMMTILGGSDAHESETPEYVDKAIPRYDAFPPPGATDDFSFIFAD